jgi:hypothetical protein
MPPAKIRKLHARADRNHHIALQPQLVGGGKAESVRQLLADDAAPAAVRGDRRLNPLRQSQNFRACRERSGAENDHGAARRGNDFACLVHRGRIRQRLRRAWRSDCKIDERRDAQDIPGALERDRSDASGRQLLHGCCKYAWDRGRMVDALSPFGEPAQERELIRQFVQDAVAAADIRRRNLACQAQHRRIGRIGRTQCGGGIEQTRPRNAAIDADLAGRLRIAKGHVGRALLVARADEADLGAALVQGVE